MKKREKQQRKTLTIELPDFLRNSAAEYLGAGRAEGTPLSMSPIIRPPLCHIRAHLTFELERRWWGGRNQIKNTVRSVCIGAGKGGKQQADTCQL